MYSRSTKNLPTPCITPVDTQSENTPDVIAPNVYPTAPCIVGFSAGGSGPGFSLTFGKGTRDDDCTRIEYARALDQKGERQGAIALLCQNPDVYAAMPRRCELARRGEDDYLPPVPVAIPAPVAPLIAPEPVAVQASPVKHTHIMHKKGVSRQGCK
jgi:hypothetical protein